MGSLNLAGRAGRWSTRHWKTAAFGWLAFAVVAVSSWAAPSGRADEVVGIANGDSRRAEQILDQADFKFPARESVLVQSRSSTVDEAAFTAAIAGVVQTLSEHPNVDRHHLPGQPPERGARSRAIATPRWSSSTIKGKADDAKDKIAPILAAVDGVQAGFPGVIVEEFGQASAHHELDQRFASDMNRAELTSLPLTIGILIVAFGALVAAGLPVLLAFSAVLAATGLNSLVSHLVPTDAADARRDHPDDRDGGRDRLFAVLPAPRARGASPRPRSASGAAPHGAHVRAGRADLRRDRADRDGRDVRLGQLAVHDDRPRDDDRRPRSDDRLAHRPSRPCSHRLGDKVDKGRIPLFRGRPRDDGRWGRFIAGVLRRPAIAMLVSAGALLLLAMPALSMHTKLPNLTDLPHDLKIVRTYERIQHAFPGSQTPAVVVVKAPNVDTPADAARIRPLPAARARDRRALRAVHRHREPGPHRRADRLRDRGERRQRSIGAALHTLRDYGHPADRRRSCPTPTSRSRVSPPARTTSTTRCAPGCRTSSCSCSGLRSRCCCSRSGRS